jgi:hypothetical protein
MNTFYETERHYGVNSPKLIQLFSAGFVASIAAIVFSFICLVFNIPTPEVGSLYGAILNGQIYPDAWSGKWWLGIVGHIFLGTFAFSLFFDFLADRNWLPSKRRVKGLVYGVILSLLFCIVVAPLAGDGIFFSIQDNSLVRTFMSFLAGQVYAMTLESMTRVRIAHHMPMTERRAA